jgi:hypothetical protein
MCMRMYVHHFEWENKFTRRVTHYMRTEISFKIIFGQFLNFSFSTHKQCILSKLYTTGLLCISLKPYTMEGFEPGSSVPEADVTPPGQYRDLVSVNLRNFTSDKVDRKTF